MSDDSNGHRKSIDDRFSSVHEDEIRSIEKRLGLLTAEVTISLRAIRDQMARQTQRSEFIVDFLRTINGKLDRALNDLDGLDVRNRLAAVEAEVAQKPKRRVGAGRK